MESAPPPLAVTLTPEAHAGTADRIGVELHVPAPHVAAGAALLRMPVTIVGTPTAAYPAAAIEARDDAGALPLTQADEAPGPSGTYRRYLAGRATVGDVTVRYAAPPRAVSSATRNGPLFDLRAEAGGLVGAGVWFFALPADTRPYRISLHWDLAHMPAGARGVWSFGEGDRTTVAPAEALAFSYYVVGPVKSVPPRGDSSFAFYWLKQPPFDPVALAAGTHRLYDYMARFFGDDGAPYRVFVRANPYPAGGGTGLAHSFMFAYGSDGRTIPLGADMLLAHEMAHTWPRLDGDQHPLTAWYTEGTAEYYSTVLSLRAGVIGLKRFADVIDDHAEGYYTSPFIALSNAESGRKFWTDARAQRVPYGRGFMYLVALNAKLKAASGGRRGLDDLVREVLDRQRKGEKVGLDQWQAMVARELGPAGRQDYLDMAAGKLIVPPADAFGPCFHLVAGTARPFDLGFDDMRLGVVKDLRPGSAAAAAGVREGDPIVAITPLEQVRDDPSKEIALTVRHGTGTRAFRYLPRGSAVRVWRWKRVAGVPDNVCRI